jgi:hypothetical protein
VNTSGVQNGFGMQRLNNMQNVQQHKTETLQVFKSENVDFSGEKSHLKAIGKVHQLRSCLGACLSSISNTVVIFCECDQRRPHSNIIIYFFEMEYPHSLPNKEDSILIVGCGVFGVGLATELKVKI